MARALLLHSALGAALALHMSSTESQAILLDQAEELSAVPKLRKFRELWKQRYWSEKHLWEPMPSSVQLVLGLFTVADDFEYRETVRKTWLNQMGVCYWQNEPKEGCSVYVAFVIGNNHMGGLIGPWAKYGFINALEAERTKNEKGMFVLETMENMNRDKSPVWFEEARKRFPWATHVGKTDMDTYPFLHKLVHRIEAGRGCSQNWSPYEIIGRPHDSYGPRFYRTCGGGGTCREFVSGADYESPVALPGQPWRFLSGELYVLSMPLVRQIDWFFPMEAYTEDQKVTLYVRRAAQEKDFCVVLRRLDAWYHRREDLNETYANDMRG